MSAPDLSRDSDRHVVRSARRGDQHAFSELFRRYRQRVRAAVYRIVGHRERAEDLTQETFAKAFDSLDRYRSERHFAPWLLAIAKNAATDYVRLKRPDRAISRWAVTPSEIDAASIWTSDEIGTLASAPQMRPPDPALERALRKLRPEYRKCITLHYIERRKYREIAKTMRVPEGTVATYLSRARSDLKRILEGQAQKRSNGRRSSPQ